MTTDSRSRKPGMQMSWYLFTHVLIYLILNAFGEGPYIPISQFWVSLYGKPDTLLTERTKLLNFLVNFYYEYAPEWLFFVLPVAEMCPVFVNKHITELHSFSLILPA